MAEAAALGLVISHHFEGRAEALWPMAHGAEVWGIRRAPEPVWLARRPRRRVFHWGLGPTLADFKRNFFTEGLDRYLAETEVELFSFDLGPAARRHLGLLPLAPPLGPEEILRSTDEALAVVRRFYDGPMAAENYNFYPTGLYGHITEPDFIRRYLDEFGLGLVLDLAHGAVTAHNIGCGVMEYLKGLPLEKTAELHLSRPYLPKAEKLWAADSHRPPGGREWGWLKDILDTGRIPSGVPVFLEYYENAALLARLQNRLAELIRPPAPLEVEYDDIN